VSKVSIKYLRLYYSFIALATYTITILL